MNFQDLVEYHIAKSIEKQGNLYEFLGDYQWSFDINLGKFNVEKSDGQKFSLDASVLGFVSFDAASFKWSWAEEEAPESAIKIAKQIKEFGSKNTIKEFTTSQMSVEELNVDMLSLVAMGLGGFDGFYIASYDDYAVVFLIKAPNIQKPTTAAKVIEIISQLAPTLDMNHKNILIKYLNQSKFALVDMEGKIEATAPTGEKILATFDWQVKLTEIKQI